MKKKNIKHLYFCYDHLHNMLRNWNKIYYWVHPNEGYVSTANIVVIKYRKAAAG